MAATTGEKRCNWQSPLAAAVLATILLATCLTWAPLSAEAANSGGRVGGSSFSSARSSAPRAPSSSFGRGVKAPPLTSGGGSVVYAPSFFLPMTYGGYYGGGWGWGFFGGGFFNLIFLITMAYFLFSFFQGMFGGSATDNSYDYEDPRGSVVKLQVGLVGQARGLQKELDRLAEKADTDTPEGLHFVLQEAVLSLLRNPDYCVYGFSEGMQGLDLDRTEDAFNRESMSERSKIKQETLINFAGVTKTGTTAPTAGTVNELIVVTLIVAVTGKLSLPPVRDNASLQEALRKLGGVRVDDLLALELLWTPQEENDVFTLDEFIRDYPRLNRI